MVTARRVSCFLSSRHGQRPCAILSEAFNVLNHTNLANPNTCVDYPGTAGRITNIFQLPQS